METAGIRGSYPGSMNSCTSSPWNIPSSLLNTMMAAAPASAAFFSFREKYSSSPGVSLPLSASTTAPATSSPARSCSRAYPPNITGASMGASGTTESTIGMTTNGSPFTDRVATWLDVRLLYVAPHRQGQRIAPRTSYGLVYGSVVSGRGHHQRPPSGRLAHCRVYGGVGLV